MFVTRHALAAVLAASCLVGGAASAADTPPAAWRSPTDQSAPASAPTGQGTETSAVVNGQTVEVIASQPVPDTRDNRAKYGQPMSRAGRRTAPAGN